MDMSTSREEKGKEASASLPFPCILPPNLEWFHLPVEECSEVVRQGGEDDVMMLRGKLGCL
jgi:hypothetical protein